jgi:hypothetical protein
MAEPVSTIKNATLSAYSIEATGSDSGSGLRARRSYDSGISRIDNMSIGNSSVISRAWWEMRGYDRPMAQGARRMRPNGCSERVRPIRGIGQRRWHPSGFSRVNVYLWIRSPAPAKRKVPTSKT